MISKTAYVRGEPTGPDGPDEPDGLRAAATQVLLEVETWAADGVDHDVVLALVQNALPLADDACGALPRLQRRSHARVLVALLLLLDHPVAGALATELVEVLAVDAPPLRALVG